MKPSPHKNTSIVASSFSKRKGETKPFITTVGPISDEIVDIELTDGPPHKIHRINRILNRRIKISFRPHILIWDRFIFVRDINFTIQYKQDIDSPSLARFAYTTIVGDFNFDADTWQIPLTNVTSITCTLHTLTVKNFTGVFAFRGKKLLRPRPALFGFSGHLR